MKIDIRGLCKHYGSLQILKNFNLEIHDNFLTCLYGKSGCGKTTLLNIIGLIEDYDQGDIFYDGQKVLKSKEVRKFLRNKIGFVFQNFGLVENLTVVQNIRISEKNKKLSLAEIEKALNKFGLSNILSKKIYELSGGEQQRVALAKILLKDVDLILADEPTASLDGDNASQVMNILRTFTDLGKTVVIVSHDERVREKCDYSYDIEEFGLLKSDSIIKTIN